MKGVEKYLNFFSHIWHIIADQQITDQDNLD